MFARRIVLAVRLPARSLTRNPALEQQLTEDWVGWSLQARPLVARPFSATSAPRKGSSHLFTPSGPLYNLLDFPRRATPIPSYTRVDLSSHRPHPSPSHEHEKLTVLVVCAIEQIWFRTSTSANSALTSPSPPFVSPLRFSSSPSLSLLSPHESRRGTPR